VPNGAHTERIVRAETRLEDVRDDIAELKDTVDRLDPTLAKKADVLAADFHKLELRLASLEARIMTWGSALMGLVIVAGVIVPVVMSLMGG
jgi:ubiquinone biosynthesis protein UbiJ